ncbi:sulfite exporter TauE/SafE family protein [Salinisphaera sp. SWV1]|uniref:sulfite exporter TauE/SafE family protein n=1 Tax=Salinisphaera sp. SWV1 TaxID=3454139 RepID=UPI003F8753DF
MIHAMDIHGLLWLAALAGALLATGLVAGLMAGLLGVGGGIVIVPVLYNLFAWLGIDSGVRMHVAVATSLATIIPTSIVSARAHYQHGSLDPGLLRSLAPGVVAGVFVGTALAGWVSGAVLTGVFAVVALIVARNMALRVSSAALAEGLPGKPARWALGAVIGGFSSLMGIGGGTLSVPLLSLFDVPMRRAVGTAAAIGLIISVPGALGMVISGLGAPHRPPGSLGYVNLIGFALIVPVTVLMAPVGARLAHSVNPLRLRQVFALFLLLTSLRMFVDLFGG